MYGELYPHSYFCENIERCLALNDINLGRPLDQTVVLIPRPKVTAIGTLHLNLTDRYYISRPSKILVA